MQYRINPKNGEELSQLGYGCMRFPKNGNKIDQQKTNELVRKAIESGMNYFDTAYIYGGSEAALGEALKTLNARDKVKIATKLPIIMCRVAGDFDKFFNKQLERLQTDYVDYYFMHMLCDVDNWERLKSLGILEWLMEKRQSGKIKNVGFSFHGGRHDFIELVDAYDWDFTMIQYNYLDEFSQASAEGLRYASGKGLPVFVMEPLRGGTLVNGLSSSVKEIFHHANASRSLAEWGLRWVWNHKEVTLLLSGMSSMEQLEENLKLADDATADSLTETDMAAYADVLKELNKTTRVPCTGCGYCMPCPRGVDIPNCFKAYNESYSLGYMGAVSKYFMSTGGMTLKQSGAHLCVGCKKCEHHCPQQIQISQRIPEVSKRMKSRMMLPVLSLARKIMIRK